MSNRIFRGFPEGRWIALVLGLLSGSNVPAIAADPPLPAFSAQVEANFKEWDLNADGTLSFDETSRLVPNTKVRDTAAAALAAVHLAQRMDQWQRVGFSRENLVAAPGGVLDRRPPFSRYYDVGLKHIRATDRVLFADDAPSLPTIRQGLLGDCYFVATLGALIQRNPKDVRRLIQSQSDGSFLVRFLNGEEVRVPFLTDAEIALGSFAGGQGLWLNVLEKAYGELIQRSRTRRGIREDAIDAVGDGGRPTLAMTLFTGCDSGLLRFRPDDPLAVPSDLRVEGFLPLTHELLNTNRQRRLLTCCATTQGDVPPGMIKQHLYAVLDYDPTRYVVQLWNPWGNSFEPKGTPGRSSGYATRHGRFSVPLADFIRIFYAVIYETNRQAGF